MATITTGIISPKSYALTTEPPSVKMSTEPETTDSDFESCRNFEPVFDSNANTSESESENHLSNRSSFNHPSDDLPKRNKRKNFKPRCSNINYSDSENREALNLSEFSNNNNLKNVRRRKTLSTRKLVLESHFTPIDLSAGRSQDSSDSEDASDDTETEPDTKIPSSFSITNLSKPHVPEFGNGTGSGVNQGQIMTDMREFAVNTMRELLGIYGSEVAESITRQFPIAAFSSGKILEYLNLTPPKQETTPPSQPPTPPSTPLSPPNLNSNSISNSNSVEVQKQIPTTLPQLPNVSITRAVSPIQSLPRNLQTPQKGPLDLGSKKKKTPSPLYTNGVGLNLTQQTQTQQQQQLQQFQQQLQQQRQQQQSPPTPNLTNLNLQTDDNSSQFGSEIDALRSKMADLTKMATLQNQSPRGIFPANFMQLAAHMHGEQTSPPPQPQENTPLNAMLAQSVSPATMSRDSPATPGLLNKSQVPLDYSRYVKRFSSSLECGSSYCKDLNYREHFHCLDCNSRVFVKKEEMIRHFKWHKKRDESLQHGFMRYSPMDDCSDRYHNCSHNRKQTHYHCIKEGCDKVYISTSDVQMHANYHRKDSAIIQEGFQRFRATEECGASYCAFFGQRTTHFHCRRPGCKFTFKNKADMEKHKSYHIKDEQLSRDGFKKFMKHETCPYENCRFSKVCNHIHCIRPQCNYVLHSSGQLFSHKRKHERKDSELAYRKFKLAQSMMRSLQEGGSLNMSLPQSYEQAFEGIPINMIQQNSMSNSGETSSDGRVSPVSYDDFESSAMDLSANDGGYNSSNMESDPAWNNEDFWRKYLQFFAGHEKCYQNCELSYSEHYHCMVENCDMLFTCRDGVREHARNHEQQEQVTEAFYITVDAQNGRCDDSCIYQDKDRHYHCNWDNCREVILPTDKPFRRLDHYKMHEYSRKLSLTKDPLTMTHLATSIDGMFRRKRGRPPKNRVIEVWNDYSPVGGQGLMDSPQAIFTSFKLPKPSTSTPSSSRELETENSFEDRSNSSSPTITDYNLQGFDVYSENCKCPDILCPYLGNVHYHCNQIRCLYVTDRDDVLLMHSKDFHDNIEILEGFEFYDRNVDCRLPSCHSNKVNRHFHCTRENCNYSFVQYSTMAIHNQKHMNDEQPKKDVRIVSPEAQIKNETMEEKLMAVVPPQPPQENHFRAINLSSQLPATENKVSVVKASGTFYPLSTLPSERTSPTEPPKNQSSESSNQLQETTNSSSHTVYGPDLSCSRPFCKLKRKHHYHCNACNQAFSEVDKLVSHIAKHSSGALSSQMSEDNNNQNSPNQTPVKTEAKIQVAPLQSLQNPVIQAPPPPPPELENHSPIFSPPTFDGFGHFANFPSNLATQFALMSQQNAFLPQSLYQNTGIPPQLMFQHPGLMQNQYLTSQSQAPENMTSPLAAMAANLNKRALSPHEMSPEQKKARIQSSMRILKDEPVPDGYLRFRFNEDCQYQHCGYREHQTHFHCQRQDCGYSFCDKTRFVQHTARHERLDTLMGGDFQQYRANVACGRHECAYTSNLGSTQNKASHFHCLKCDFVCTDTNKVVAHRRQHQKLDSIQAAGFEKFTPSQQCRSANCQHSGKQTHYHCLSCQYAVLGLAQMSAHKYRHLEG